MFIWANKSEQSRSLPGDDYIPNAIYQGTHGIDIHATPEQIWPWLVQMGGGRAGWYSYDFLDNARKPSARKIITEYQFISVGDVMPALPGATDAFIISQIDPPTTLVLTVPILESSKHSKGKEGAPTPSYRATWTFLITSPASNQSRLLVRAKLGKLLLDIPFLGLVTIPSFPAKLLAYIIHLIMVQKQLRGIKRRVERLNRNEFV